MQPSQSNASHSGNSTGITGDVDAELALLALRSDELRKQKTSLYYWNDPVGNRRVARGDRRVNNERRRFIRLDGDRRAAHSERRVPLEVRCEKLETELEKVEQRSRELTDLRRQLSHPT